MSSSVLYADSRKHKVLVIESYHKEMYWDAGYRRGIEKVIGEKVDLFYFEMDTKRLPKPQYPHRIALALTELDRVNPDIVILGDDNALKFLGREIIKRKIPLVFLGINSNPREYFDGVIPKGVTGVLERPPLKRSLEFIRQAQPEWEKVLVLFDNSNTSKIYKNSAYFFHGKSLSNYLDFEVEVYFSNNLTKLRKKIMEAQTTHDAIFLGGLNTVLAPTGDNVNWETITEWIYQHSKIPLFGFWRGNVGFNKSIGGYVADGQYIGEQAAYIVDRILNGEEPEQIKIEHIRNVRLVLSPSSLKHWDIQLPKNSMRDAEFID